MTRFHELLGLTLLLVFSFQISIAQKKESDPIIDEYGEVWKIENQDYTLDTSKTFKAVFDIMSTPDDLDQVNPSIETAARFLNMHGQNGVPLEQLKVALVIHNKASKDVISSEAYEKKYGTKNPNEDLLNALLAANVEIIFCGQSSVSGGFPKEDLIQGVQLSLSAMTALIQLQDDNYRLIKF
ncbi:DsrE family protein [Maribacter litopenaei]|uniref:DsrE family protein n=1 Tax=Maribacter litopenaei TaxID=2976127 RepID=A0ABY5YBX0_9FLAO|nr:DsrE family protein [Maribacter litopenaei]UWX56214.1 DsrE family protein [Maribacter litopenaei]